MIPSVIITNPVARMTVISSEGFVLPGSFILSPEIAGIKVIRVATMTKRSSCARLVISENGNNRRVFPD